MQLNKFINANSLEYLNQLNEQSVDCIVTSPPYYTTQHKYQRGSGFHYSTDIGEPLYLIEDISPLLYRVLKNDGALALNLGFSYGETGVMRPFRIIERFLRDGWFPYDTIIWHKNNPIPIKNRLTNAFEYIFILSKSPAFKYKKEIKYEHNVWKFSVESKDWGTASFPITLPKNCIEILTKENETVLDPFMGSGTTALACKELNRNFIGIEINKEYIDISEKRLKDYEQH
jgi:DNA modification methylase